MTQLGIDRCRINDGRSNLLPQELTIPAAQPVHHFLDRSLRGAKPLGRVLVRGSRLTASQVVFELGELSRPISRGKLLPEPSHRTLQNREGPPPFEQRLGIQGLERLVRVSSLRLR